MANLMYCHTYYNAIPLQSYGLIGNLADYYESVIDSFKWYYIFLPLITLFAFIFYSFDKKIKKIQPSPFLYLCNLIILFIIIWANDAWRGGIIKRMDFMANYAYLSSSIPPIYSLGGFLIHDYYKTSEQLSDKDLQFVREWLKQHERNSSSYWQDTTRAQRKHPKNIVVVLCESLESWVIDKSIEGKEITPNLNRLINDSSSFFAPNVITQVGSGRSIEGQLLILAGLLPMFNKVYAYDAVYDNFFTIPKAIKSREGQVIQFTPDKPYVWNQALVAPAFGVDSLIDASEFIIDETTGTTKRLSDASLMRQISEKLKDDKIWKAENPEMLLIVTNSGHNPFNLPEQFRQINFDLDYPKIIKDYMVTANYTDASLKTLIDYFRSRKDWEETMVVITGDHEGLASDRKTAVANKLSKEFVDSLPHTPLIILNSPVQGRFDGELGQVDIYSTILDLMDYKDYPWKGLGISIFNPDHPQVALSSDGSLKGDLKKAPDSLINHIIMSREVSDKILKFNLLKNYPDSIP